jgi:hypothetical protein
MQRSFEKFSTTTVIRVFNFIRTASSLIERVFWIIVLLLFTSVTVWDIYQTINRYMAEPTGSVLTFPVVSSHNFQSAIWSITVSRERLIALYGNESLVDEIITNFSTTPDMVRYFREKLEKIHAIDRVDSVNHSRKSADNVEIDASLQAYYNKKHARSFGDRDVALVGLTSAMLLSILDTEILGDPRQSDQLFESKALKKLYKFYTTKNTDFRDLLFVIGESICVIEQVQIFSTRRDIETDHYDLTIADVCQNSVLRFLAPSIGPGAEVVTYRFSDGTSPFVFYTTFDSVTMTVQPNALYRGNAIGHLTIDLAGWMAGREQPLLLLELNRRHEVLFGLETRSTSASLRRKRCQSVAENRGIRVDCIYWCRAEFLARECHCTPLFSAMATKFAEAPKGEKNCAENAEAFDQIIYLTNEKCRIGLTASMAAINETCSYRCYDNCRVDLFSTAVTTNESIRFALNVSTVVQLSSLKFIFLNVVEYKTMDERQLITSLGGNLSLYLGASFLALIHILVFFVKLPFDVAGLCKTSEEKALQLQQKTDDKAEASKVSPGRDEAMIVVFDELAKLRREMRRMKRRQLFHRVEAASST